MLRLFFLEEETVKKQLLKFLEWLYVRVIGGANIWSELSQLRRTVEYQDTELNKYEARASAFENYRRYRNGQLPASKTSNLARALLAYGAEGAEGPATNTHGVHPFNRWNISGPKPEEI